MKCAVGVTEGFEVKVGLDQGSHLSPCLFAMVTDWMTDKNRKYYDVCGKERIQERMEICVEEKRNERQ